MGSIPVGDSDFTLSHARVTSINSPFAFITEHKIHHLYSLLNIHEVIGPRDQVILVQETETDS